MQHDGSSFDNIAVRRSPFISRRVWRAAQAVAWRRSVMSRVSQPMRKRPPAPARRSSGEVLSRIGMGLVLIAATVAVYWPALRGGLIMDDPEHITVPGLQSWAG